METEILTPKNETEWLALRAENLNSTEIPALFDLSPYMTKFELWHRHKENIVVEFEENARTLWGKRLQNSIAQGIADDQGWEVSEMKEYIRCRQLRIGSSFDFSINKWDRSPYSDWPRLTQEGILEIKNVDFLQFRDKWTKNDDGTFEAPAHIELQVQHQLMLSGRSYAYIGALIAGNDIKLIRREADPEIHAAIQDRAASFWHSIDTNKPPEPDFSKDADIISKLYGYAEPGKTLTTDSDDLLSLVSQYREAGRQATEYENHKKAIKAQILSIIGDVERVEHPLFTISAKTSPPTFVNAFERAAFRNFRVTERKTK
jgi:predicted phage-related endonuclease